MNISLAILGLALLVFIHEAGHFFVARAVGMRPRRFYVGFPPALAKVRRNGIEYGIGAIPLGGYVKIPGMHRPAPADVDAHLRRPLEEAPKLAGAVDRVKRALGAAEYDAALGEVDALERCAGAAALSPAAAESAGKGVRELRDGLAPDAYWRQATWKKVAVILAGPAANIVAALALLIALFMAGVPTGAARLVDEVLPGSPAAQIGLRAGDEIVALNGDTVTAAQISEVIRASEGEPVAVTVRRDGAYRALPPAQPTEMDGAPRLGFALAVHYERFGPVDATRLAGEETLRVTKAIGVALYDIVSGRDRTAVATPVGVVQGSSQALEVGVRQYLQVLALISLSLALLNLLPLLPLDGGHITFSLLESLRGGRAIGRGVYERAAMVGIVFVLFLFAIGLSNDITRIRGG